MTQNHTGINSVGLHDLQERIAYLKENDGLKGAVKARDILLISLSAMWQPEHKQ